MFPSAITTGRFVLRLTAVLALAAAGCTYGHRIAYHVFEAPLDALSITHIEPDKVLVLAGTVEEGKNVSVFYDSIYSQELIRFPVSRFASAIRGGGDGKFYLSIAGSMPRRSGRPKTWGALEQWNIEGQLLSTTRFSGPVIALTQVADSVIYALMSAPQRQLAIGIRVTDGRPLGALRLAADVDSLDQCRVNGERYLLISSNVTHRVRLVGTKSQAIVDTSMIASQPRCSADSSTIIGIDTLPFGTEVALLHLAAVNERTDTIVAPADTVEIEPAPDGRLYLLRRFGGDSNIQVWTASEVADAAG